MERNYWAALFYGGGSDFLSAVQALEDRGLPGLAIPQVYGPPFVPLAAAATVTKRMLLATGIAIGLTRSPFETAMAALDPRSSLAGPIHSWAGHWPDALHERVLRYAL